MREVDGRAIQGLSGFQTSFCFSCHSYRGQRRRSEKYVVWMMKSSPRCTITSAETPTSKISTCNIHSKDFAPVRPEQRYGLIGLYGLIMAKSDLYTFWKRFDFLAVKRHFCKGRYLQRNKAKTSG